MQKNIPDVNVAFRTLIPVGESDFEVSVPHNFRDRYFYFADLSIVPDFYSVQAAILGLDVDDELDAKRQFPMYFSVNFIKDAMFPDGFTQQAGMNTVGILIKNINQFSESKKPTGLQRLPVFMDWIDLRFAQSTLTLDEYVKMFAIVYYGEEYDVAKHYNALPVSARTVSGVNNYLYPTTEDALTLQNIRVRINIASNVSVHFSTNSQLNALGFSDRRLGKRVANQYVMKNPSTNAIIKISGDGPPSIEVPVKPALGFGLKMNSLTYTSNDASFEISKRKDLNDKNYETGIQELLTTLAKATNIVVAFSYNASTKIFSFGFPNNEAMRVTVNLPIALAERLGFGLVDQIKESNKSGSAIPSDLDVVKSHEKAVALVMDTSLVVVTDNNTTSNTTAGSNELFMAALKPTWSGTMEMSAQAFCTQPPVCRLPTTSDGHREIVAQFKLYRFLDMTNALVPLVWKNDAYVSGVLRGTYKK